jgi:hypothetical protein
MRKELSMLTEYMLTGSRSKITDSRIEDSDWDYAAPYSEKNVNALLANGFSLISVPGHYKDDLTVCILEKYDGQIQVTLKSDFALYKKVWVNITPEFFEGFLWKKYTLKEKIKDLLNMLFKVAK